MVQFAILSFPLVSHPSLPHYVRTDIRLRQQGTDMGFLGEELKRRHTLPRSFGSSASESEASADLDEPGNNGPTVEQTVDGLWRRLGELRKEAGRPNNPEVFLFF